MSSLQDQFFDLVRDIEQRWPVTDWRIGEVDVWPVARIALRNAVANTMVFQPNGPRSRMAHAAERTTLALKYAATPVINLWQWRSDLVHLGLVPERAHALFLGDGVKLDRIDGIWQDRFCEPLIQALDSAEKTSVLAELGEITRHPVRRTTLLVNTIERWARLAASSTGVGNWLEAVLPAHDDVLRFVGATGVRNDVLSEQILRSRAGTITTMAWGFRRLLRRVRPSLGFMITYYCDTGYAFAMACRSCGVLSIDLQHGNQGGQHQAYNMYYALPDRGYSNLPAVFWNWTEEDTKAIDLWTSRLARPWHRGLQGGHPQLALWLDDQNSMVQESDVQIEEIRARLPASLDILVALQDLDEYREIWNRLADLIERGPTSWRWWLRRHPTPTYDRGRSIAALLAIDRPNVLIEEATSRPLPALLRHMDVTLSLFSGVSIEASIFGIKSIFLSEEARGAFGSLVRAGKADVVTDMRELADRLSMYSSKRGSPFGRSSPPDIAKSLQTLERWAEEYRSMSPEVGLGNCAK